METATLPCTASVRIALRQPSVVLQHLCRNFEEHASVTREEKRAWMQTRFGIARLEADDATLTVQAESVDETRLSYMKWSLAENLLNVAAEEKPAIEWLGQKGVGELLPTFSEMTVVGKRTVTPLMERVTLRGGDIERLATAGLHVRLLLPQDGHAPEWPTMGADGRPCWPEGKACPVQRIYTIRSVDREAGTIDIDMVLHEGSAPGSDFARAARQGDVIGMMGPSGDPVPDADWYLLAGDETALPAIARMLENLPAQSTAVVRIEVASGAEEQQLSSPAELDLQWVHRDGVPAGYSPKLQQAVEAVAWPQDERRIYAWGGCEYGGFKQMRKFLRDEKRLARDQHHAAGYWRLNPANHH